MQSPDYHDTLLAQFRQSLGHVPEIPPALRPLFQLVSDTYTGLEAAKVKAEAETAARTDQLIASTSRAYSFLDTLNMGLVLCDTKPEVVLTNQPVQRMLRAPASPQSPARMWDLDYIDEVLGPAFNLRQLITDSLRENKPIERDDVTLGQQIVRLFIAPMVNEVKSGQSEAIGAVILVEDMTEQKMLERSKDEFLSIASHELRTPLTAIRGNASLIKKYYLKDLPESDLPSMIDDIHESSIRLISIVNDFLDASALEQSKMIAHPEAFRLVEVAGEVAHEVQALGESKHVRIVCDASLDNLPEVFADRQRTKQVVYNLVGNALKFTEDGNITVHGRADATHVYISVTDTGRGMSPESQRLLFRKFQQAGSSLLTRDTTKGTGLGLYISKLIVELSGGTIGLESSAPGEGSTFTFSLPMAGSDTIVKSSDETKKDQTRPQ